MRQSFIGPLSVEKFLKEFLPAKGVFPPSFSPGFQEVAKATCETDMYEPFVRTVNKLLKRFKAFNTSNTPSTEAEAEFRPDVTIYEKNAGSPKQTLTSFQRMEMFIEFKHGSSVDPFVKEDRSQPKISNIASAIRGQLALYATRQQAYQFRTSIISVGIFGKFAYFFRWDRSGCLVTTPIDYSKSKGNQQLTEFFLRLDRMANDREGRGWDQTVVDPTAKEIEKFNAAIQAVCGGEHQPQPPIGRIRTRGQTQAASCRGVADPMFSKLFESVGDHEKYPRKKVSVLHGGVTKTYLVGRPTSTPKSPTGRATRGFVAFCLETGKLVFLKDSWRPDVRCIKQEDHWYQRLQEKEGPGKAYIGSYSHGSDVYATRNFVKCRDMRQRTVTHRYAKTHKREEAIMGYIHYRVVQAEFYLPLEMFRDSKHLVSIMHDVAMALDFVHKAEVFHRDISLGNIMIDVHGRGRLIDFDLARTRSERGARQTMRTGTWQFISTAQLCEPGGRYVVSDELESFFFVILYVALHWIIHNKPYELNVKHIFDQSQILPKGDHVGGEGKFKMYTYTKGRGVVLHGLEFTESPPLTDLIRQLFRLFQSLAQFNYSSLEPGAGVGENVEKLKDCDAILRLMQEALAREDWPEVCDKTTTDNYPREEETDQKDQVGHAHVKVSIGPSRARVVKRALGEDASGVPKKRSRIDRVIRV